MNRLRALLSLVCGGIACLALAGVAEAGGPVPRAFVSINGSDSNPCSAVQPCRSFNQALTVVQPGGEIVVQDSGGYSTGFTITQSVTIDAAGFNASVISTDATDLCTINAGPTDRVVLRGISFHGANVGQNAINDNSAGSLYVEHCSISEFASCGVFAIHGGNIFVTGTDMRACQFGIGVQGVGAIPTEVFVQDSRFTECKTGILVATLNITEVNLIAHDTHFMRCSFGVSLEADGPADAHGSMTNCTAAVCAVGFRVRSNSANNADLALTNCRATSNTLGLDAATFGTGNAIIRIAGCLVTHNIQGVGVGNPPSAIISTSPGTNLIAGNNADGSVSGTSTLQ
jgi:hypothetical protein